VGGNSAAYYFSPGFSAHQIVNEGRIIAGAGSTGIALMTNDQLTNSGLIMAGPNGSALTATGSFRDLSGRLVGVGGEVTIINSGTIDGLLVLGGNLAHPNTLTNSGTIARTQGPLGQEHFITGSFTQTASGRISLRVTPGDTCGIYDRFVVGGPANLDGALVLEMQPGTYANSTSYSFLVFPYAGLHRYFCGCTDQLAFLPRHFDPVQFWLAGRHHHPNLLQRGGATNDSARAVGAALEAGYIPSTAQSGSLYNRLIFSGDLSDYDRLADQASTGTQDNAIWAGALMSDALQARVEHASPRDNAWGSGLWARASAGAAKSTAGW
jgi:hypothetical protein